MAIIPSTYAIGWYDPSQPGGVVTPLNNNANTATSNATQYTMEDIINTVSYTGGSIDGSGAQWALPVFTDTNTITNLPLGNAGEILTSGGAGVDPSWASAAYLPLAGGTMTGVAGVDVPDNFKWNFGNAQELEIYNDNVNTSYIVHKSGLDFRITTTGGGYIKLMNNLSSMINCAPGDHVALFYNGAKKFETTVTGTKTQGQMDIAALNTAPANAADAGTLGEIRYTADYIYVCVATDTWKRSALTTW